LLLDTDKGSSEMSFLFLSRTMIVAAPMHARNSKSGVSIETFHNLHESLPLFDYFMHNSLGFCF